MTAVSGEVAALDARIVLSLAGVAIIVARGDPRVLANLQKRFAEGPIDWTEYLKRTKAYQDAEDAKAAIAWVRQNAQRLGIDPNEIAASGECSASTCSEIDST